MNDQDHDMLGSLGFREKGNAGRWRVLLRGGHVLLLLPDQPKILKKGLGLYRPQRWPARLSVAFIRHFPMGHLILRKISGECEEGGAVRTVLKSLEAKLVGVLLGNPTQKERRAVLLVESREGDLVIKLGNGRFGRNKISKELAFLEENAFGHPFLPRPTKAWRDESWEAFAIPYGEGSEEIPIERIIEVLRSWCPEAPPLVANDFEEWKEVLLKVSDENERDKLSEQAGRIRLRRSLCHRDFVPWNIVSTNEGEIVVIDWEFGRRDGVPGWDLVHYLFLTANLVDRLTPAEAATRTVEKLGSEERFKELLHHWGWQGNVKLLVKSYFYSMGGLLEDSGKLARSVDAA